MSVEVAKGRGIAAPVTILKGVGAGLAGRLARLGIHTVGDLLFHLPLRYQDRTRITPMGMLRPGDEALVCGEVLLTEVKYGRRRMLLSHLGDGTGALTLRFFHFNAGQQAGLAQGVWLQCFGEVRRGPATLEMVHPEYRQVAPGTVTPPETRLTPVYPATEGLGQAGLRRLVERALALVDRPPPEGLVELLPQSLLERLGLPPLRDALAYVHRPPRDADAVALRAGRHPMQRRLAFEELLAHHLSLRRLRQRRRRQRAPALRGDGSLAARLLEALPFEPTSAQRRVMEEIRRDLGEEAPMQRLVQGDVGSGKTLVAAAAVLGAVEAGHQAVVMAPTELLSEQHYRNFRAWLDPLGVDVVWLSGRARGRERAAILARLADGGAQVAVGTHALFQDDVAFRALGLVVVDEQHRFGVHQRLALREKGRQGDRHPHQLIMTATPIPRTLMMSAYADLDCSVIDELPPGRQPVETVIVSDRRRAEVLERVRHVCLEGRQAYWVCTLIEESEQLQCQAATETAALLAEALPGVRVGLVHGRMSGTDKEAAMAAFKAGDIQLLVATTVIEVGVDVPNASLMIIENAERLGLAQLHQLRGRVGRGAEKSVCVLMYHAPLSGRGRERLAALRATNDGFEIARRDLALRGPGEVLGTRQAGVAQLRVADLLRDQDLLPGVNEAAGLLLQRYPERVAPLIRRWLGEGTRYAVV